jgi:hypothetical protein
VECTSEVVRSVWRRTGVVEWFTISSLELVRVKSVDWMGLDWTDIAGE